MKSRGRIAIVILVLSLAGRNAASAVTPVTCASRANDTVSKLTECVMGPALLQRLNDFQDIANTHGGNRDSGDPGGGYEASVQYVSSRMAAAGYDVTVQTFPFRYFKILSTPVLSEVSPVAQSFDPTADFGLLDGSGSGNLTSPVQAAGGIVIPPNPSFSSASGCSSADFAGFTPGGIALIQRGTCDFAAKAANAQAAGAAAAIIFNEGTPGRTDEFSGILSSAFSIPVLSASFAVGQQLDDQIRLGTTIAHIAASTISETRTSENVFAETPGGNRNSVLVAGAHLDSLYGAGILDNASGSGAVLEIALQMSRVKPLNKVRFAWWGAEEEGITGSAFYIDHLSRPDLEHIAFYLDADVIATPNFYVNVLDPAQSPVAASWTKQAIRASGLATRLFGAWFDSVGSPFITVDKNDLPRSDTLPFLNAGIPVGGVFTGQGDLKSQAEVDLFGGFVGLTESCADEPAGCDDLSNVNPAVFDLVSKSYAAVAIQLAFDARLESASGGAIAPRKLP